MNKILIFFHLSAIFLVANIVTIWIISKIHIQQFLGLLVNPVSNQLPDTLLFVTQIMCILLITSLLIVIMFWINTALTMCAVHARDPQIDNDHISLDLFPPDHVTLSTHPSRFRCKKCFYNICELWTITIDGST